MLEERVQNPQCAGSAEEFACRGRQVLCSLRLLAEKAKGINMQADLTFLNWILGDLSDHDYKASPDRPLR